jgi:exosortase A
MTAHQIADTATGSVRLRHLDAVVPLVIGIAVLGFMFQAEALAAYQVWNDSTAYSHCFFVLPIALYLAWDRRGAIAGMQIAPLPWMGLLALPGVAAWMAAERMGIMEGRQLVAMSFVQLLFLAVLGWRMWWAMSAPLLYLYFMVPFGAFLTPWLQVITLHFSLVGLDVLGVPFYADEFLIDTRSGRYFVAEACAGLRFLIASVAFGVLYACLIYRSPWRRAGFMLASIVIPIVANGFRALGIVLLGEVLGSAEAAAADHIIYGWVFFSFVIVLLILAGMPFREDQQPEPAPVLDPRPRAPMAGLRAAIATVLVVGFAGSAAAASAWLDQRAVAVAVTSPPVLQPAAGCVAAGPAVMQLPGIPGGAHPLGSRSVETFTCANANGAAPLRLSITVQAFPTRVNPGAIVQIRRILTREEASEEMEYGSLPMAAPGAGGEGGWRLVTGSSPPVMSASALWLDGAPSRGGLSERIRQARNSVDGAPAAPVLVVAAMQFPSGQLKAAERDHAKRVLATFLANQPSLAPQMAALARAAAGS